MNPDYDFFARAKSRWLGAPRRSGALSRFEKLLETFSPSERFALYALAILLGASALVLLAGLNAAISVQIPARGGALVEGEIAPARFIDPVLSLSQADDDISALVYSGLMRALPDGSLVPDLAQSYAISPDGKTYTFELRPGATFQDGTPVTAGDVLFTVQAIQNPGIKSPHLADWEGVKVSSPDPQTVVFTLPQAYTPFIENTTLGILPAHLWQSVPAEEFPFSPANTRPVGSGPYKVAGVSTDETGSPVRYDLAPFGSYALGEPYLSRITFVFYPNAAAEIAGLNAGAVDAVAGISPQDLPRIKRASVAIASVVLPRAFGVFFNQNRAPVLSDSSVREALDAAVDKQAIVQSVLGGYGVALDGPVPPGITGGIAPAEPAPFSPAASSSAASAPNPDDVAATKAILEKGGWQFDSANGTWIKKKQALSFALATGDEPELIATANEVASMWRAAGIKVEVHVYPLSELNGDVIRPRQYDALLFGEVVGPSPDLFAFWDSSERNDPGLNLAMYANAKADALLLQARATTDKEARDKLYAQFASLIEKDRPAVFLFAPDLIYIVPQTLRGVELGVLATPTGRFLNAYQWYTDTERVWNFFAK